MPKLHDTEFFTEFIDYYDKASTLQQINVASENGRDTSEDLHVDDPLMHHITIYDTVDRRFAGFSNMLQQIWFGSDNPKRWQAESKYDKLHDELIEEEWLWLFLFHRLTGSGASFSHDHGFRNTLIPEILENARTIQEMRDFTLRTMRTGQPIFTSIGNTIPMFPKPRAPYERASEFYFAEYMNHLVRFVHQKLMDEPLKRSVREVVDLINAWHREHGLKCFHFQMTAWAMDIAEYFPRYIDQYSRVNYGKNAVEALETLFVGEGFKNKSQFLDAAMDRVVDSVRSPMNPEDHTRGMAVAYSAEDVACDFIRYLGCYVPQGYEYLEPWQVENRSKVDYPKHWTYELHVESKK